MPDARRSEGSGAPKDNQNALKTRLYTREMMQERRWLNDLIRESRETLRAIT